MVVVLVRTPTISLCPRLIGFDDLGHGQNENNPHLMMHPSRASPDVSSRTLPTLSNSQRSPATDDQQSVFSGKEAWCYVLEFALLRVMREASF